METRNVWGVWTVIAIVSLVALASVALWSFGFGLTSTESLQNQVDDLIAQRNSLQSQVTNLQDQVASLNTQSAEKQQEIKDLRALVRAYRLEIRGIPQKWLFNEHGSLPGIQTE